MYKILCLLFLLFSSSLIKAENWPSYDLPQNTNKQFPDTTIIRINKDPVYQVEKHYKAYPLDLIIKKLAKDYKEPMLNCLIVFTAKDGYKVTMSYSDALKDKGYIAFKDLAANKKSWLKFKFGNQTTTPAPYYLVWPNSKLDKWRYPSPFQLTRISLQSMESYFSGAVPESQNKQVKNGFSLFSRYCIRCHSVNRVGGKLGPELNYPKNITDYFTADKLTDFILNARSFNRNTKMPLFKNILTQKEALLIQRYLKAMKPIKPSFSNNKK